MSDIVPGFEDFKEAKAVEGALRGRGTLVLNNVSCPVAILQHEISSIRFAMDGTPEQLTGFEFQQDGNLVTATYRPVSEGGIHISRDNRNVNITANVITGGISFGRNSIATAAHSVNLGGKSAKPPRLAILVPKDSDLKLIMNSSHDFQSYADLRNIDIQNMNSGNIITQGTVAGNYTAQSFGSGNIHHTGPIRGAKNATRRGSGYIRLG